MERLYEGARLAYYLMWVMNKLKGEELVFNIDKMQILKPTEEQFENIYKTTISRILDNIDMKDKIISVVCENKIKKMTVSKLVMNMIFLKPFIKYKRKIKYDDIFDIPDTCTFGSVLNVYIELTLQKFQFFFDDKTRSGHLSEIAAQLVRDLVKLTDKMSYLTMNSFSLYDIIKLSERNPTFNMLQHFKLDDTKSIPELEADLAKGQKMLIESIKQDGMSELLPFIESKVFKPVQLAQTFFNIGLRSDSDNKVIPYVVNTNFSNGFNSVMDYYAESEVARYATIVKDRNVGDSGYLMREFDLLTHSVHVDRNVDDCGSTVTVPFEVTNQFRLNMIHNKYMVDNRGRCRPIDSTKDQNLIGTTVRLRTIIGCKCGYPKVCKTCYGNQNYRQLEERIGSSVSPNMISRFTNASMSVKHSTSTNSVEIVDETILEYFYIEKDQLFLKDNIDTSDLMLLFDREYIEDILERLKRGMSVYDDDEDDDSDDETSSHDPIRRMILVDKRYDREKDIVEDIQRQIVLEDTYLQFSDYILSNRKNFTVTHNSPYASLSLKNAQKDLPIFDITYMSKSVNMHIIDIRRLMRSEIVDKFSVAVSSCLSKMADIVESAGFGDINLRNIESIYYNMVKDPNNIYKRPDTDESDPDVHIIKMKQAIAVNAFTDGLAHEDLVSLLRNPGTFVHDTVGSNDSRYAVSRMYKIDNVMSLVRKEFPEL